MFHWLSGFVSAGKHTKYKCTGGKAGAETKVQAQHPIQGSAKAQSKTEAQAKAEANAQAQAPGPAKQAQAQAQLQAKAVASCEAKPQAQAKPKFKASKCQERAAEPAYKAKSPQPKLKPKPKPKHKPKAPGSIQAIYQVEAQADFKAKPKLEAHAMHLDLDCPMTGQLGDNCKSRSPRQLQRDRVCTDRNHYFLLDKHAFANKTC